MSSYECPAQYLQIPCVCYQIELTISPCNTNSQDYEREHMHLLSFHKGTSTSLEHKAPS